ncbi:uncharacterized protein LOC141702405 [Apium graveolens]|uniref:uncharacterized protein LOC141679555 n=1 Tax=Apium graveolens TaxID=4045 RepID=UPI003D790DD9
MQKGDRNPSNIGKAIILPASFTGSKRYMTQYFKDSLEICRTLGHPSLFLTMTTNTKWPEIQHMLKHMPGVDVADAPDVVARDFKMKVDQLIDMIKKKNCFGRCVGVMHVIKFQKHGLPHTHILIWLHPDDRPKTIEQIDKMVSAEIPDPEIDPVGYNAVSNYMIHGPCGSDYTKSPCMVKERLLIYLPGEKHVSFKAGDVLEDVCDKAISKKTKLEAWFDANQTFPNARNYSYSEFPNKFTWHPRPGIWKERKRGEVIGRLSEVHSSRKKGSRSFEDLKTVNGHIHETFKEACAALSLLQNDNQWHEAIVENSHTSLPLQLRAMFVNILAYIPISDPLRLWEVNWQCMSNDILIIRRHMLNDPHLYLSDEDLKNYALAEIEKLFNDIGKSLKDYATMPFPSEVYFSNAVNRLLQEETSYDKEELEILHEKNHGMLNPEQKNVYDSIIQNVYNKVVVFSMYMEVEDAARHFCGRHYVIAIVQKEILCFMLPHVE